MICRFDEKIAMLTDRAKHQNHYIDDLDIGESCYLLAVLGIINEFRSGFLSKEELTYQQKVLRQQLEKYYQQCEMFDFHVQIRNRYSPIMTQAIKNGCPICKQLVRIFDGRDKK